MTDQDVIRPKITMEWKDQRYILYVNGQEHSRWKNPTPPNAYCSFPEWLPDGKELEVQLWKDSFYPDLPPEKSC